MKLDFVRSIKQPFAGSAWLFNILIGAGLGLVAMLASQFGILGIVVKIAATAFTTGYVARIMLNTATSNANSNLPDWTDQPLQTALLGITLGFGAFVYSLVFSLLVSVLVVPFMAMGAVAASGAVLLVTMALGAILLPVIALMLVHLSVESRFLALIEFGAAFNCIRNRPLSVIVATLVTGALLFVSSILVSLLLGVFAAMPMVALLIGAILTFAGQLMIANLWAQVYRG